MQIVYGLPRHRTHSSSLLKVSSKYCDNLRHKARRIMGRGILRSLRTAILNLQWTINDCEADLITTLFQDIFSRQNAHIWRGLKFASNQNRYYSLGYWISHLNPAWRYRHVHLRTELLQPVGIVRVHQKVVTSNFHGSGIPIERKGYTVVGKIYAH